MVGDGGGDGRGTSLSTKSLASVSETAPAPSARAMSILLPTTTQQNSSTASSGTGALSRKSAHHFVSAASVCGWFTSNIRITASAPRKKAEDSAEKRSWPAVSCASESKVRSENSRNVAWCGGGRTHICKVTTSSGELWCGTVFVIKSAPIVALYPVVNLPEMYCTAQRMVRAGARTVQARGGFGN